MSNYNYAPVGSDWAYSTTSGKLYIPPSNIRFRLFGGNSQLVVYSDDNQKPEVSHSQKSDDQNQLFTLTNGTGDHDGTFAIKGAASGKLLVSRAEGEPKVGHVVDDGESNECWFNLVAKCLNSQENSDLFRIVCPATNTQIYSSSRMNPPFGNLPANPDVDDSYFGFTFEDLEIDAVTFALDSPANKILGPIQSVTLLAETFTNNTEESVEKTFSFDATHSYTSWFVYRDGFPLPIGKQIKCKLPTLSGGAIKLFEEEALSQFMLDAPGARPFRAQTTVTVRPHQTATMKAAATKGTVTVPFVIKLCSLATGAVVETNGIWFGESHWDLTFPVDVA
ncbi:hypothetical protein C8Q77DRAFT_1073060 [Trametes polyzona]|nr:hypothetical protein C8Q77DRAFT_1073060 [Trametes polyzona]